MFAVSFGGALESQAHWGQNRVLLAPRPPGVVLTSHPAARERCAECGLAWRSRFPCLHGTQVHSLLTPSVLRASFTRVWGLAPLSLREAPSAG